MADYWHALITGGDLHDPKGTYASSASLPLYGNQTSDMLWTDSDGNRLLQIDSSNNRITWGHSDRAGEQQTFRWMCARNNFAVYVLDSDGTTPLFWIDTASSPNKIWFGGDGLGTRQFDYFLGSNPTGKFRAGSSHLLLKETSQSASSDAGFWIRRGANTYNGVFYDESADEWVSGQISSTPWGTANLTIASYTRLHPKDLGLENQQPLGSGAKVLFASDGELYWRDGAGANVKITSDGVLKGAGGSAGITPITITDASTSAVIWQDPDSNDVFRIDSSNGYITWGNSDATDTKWGYKWICRNSTTAFNVYDSDYAAVLLNIDTNGDPGTGIMRAGTHHLMIKQGSSSADSDSGFWVRRGANLYNGVFYDESADEWAIGHITSTPWGTQNLTIAQYTRTHVSDLVLENQTALASGSNTVFATSNDLYWRNASANVQLTNGNNINAATTLDSAYDFGGAGAGRSITADTGAVAITTSTNYEAVDINITGPTGDSNRTNYGLSVNVSGTSYTGSAIIDAIQAGFSGITTLDTDDDACTFYATGKAHGGGSYGTAKSVGYRADSNFGVGFDSQGACTGGKVHLRTAGGVLIGSGTQATSMGARSVCIATGGDVSSKNIGAQSVMIGADLNQNASSVAQNYSVLIGSSDCYFNTGHNSVKIGAVGYTSGNAVSVGYNARAANNAVAIGYGTQSSAGGVTVGYNSANTYGSCLALGDSLTNAKYSIAIGGGFTMTSDYCCVIGCGTFSIKDLIVGKSWSAASVDELRIQPTKASGTNTAGAKITLRGGQSTGQGAGGAAVIATSPAAVGSGTALNAYREMISVASTGAQTHQTDDTSQNAMVWNQARQSVTAGSSAAVLTVAMASNRVTYVDANIVATTASMGGTGGFKVFVTGKNNGGVSSLICSDRAGAGEGAINLQVTVSDAADSIIFTGTADASSDTVFTIDYWTRAQA